MTGKVADWIEAWLENRLQRVVLNGEASSWETVTSGVPQGSVLGPCLFIIFINDIDTAVDMLSIIKKIADDTKLCRVIDSENDHLQLQKQLEQLEKWSKEWQTIFNIDKCKVMHVGNANKQYEYFMANEQIKTTEVEKDLGIFLDQSLKPSVQVAEAVKVANRVLGQLLRAVSYRDKMHFVRLYKQRVRCHLEYAVQCWNPWLQKDIDLLESVQRRAVRCISGLQGSYEEKLEQIGLTTLYERRRRGDLIQTYKIIHKIDDVDPKTWFTFCSDDNTRTRNNVQIHDDGTVNKTLNLKLNKARLDLRKNYFSNRVINSWNSLPEAIKASPSVNAFKSGYDSFVKT